MLKNKINFLSYISKLIKFLASKATFTRFLLLVIFVISFWIRLQGVNPGFPQNHPDEPTIYGSVKQLILYGEFKPVLYSYGGLLYELYTIIISLVFIPISFVAFFFSNSGEVILRGIPGFIESYRHSQLLTGLNFLYWSRYLTAILGSLTVVIVYLLGRELFSKSVGLLAAFFLAVNYRHVLSSVLVLADAPAGFFASLSVLLSVYLIKKPSAKVYLLAGFALGLGLSVKYFVYIFPAFLLCHFISTITNNKDFLKMIKSLFISKKLFLSLSICLLTFFIINPFILFDFNDFYHEYQYDSVRFGVTDPVSILLKYDYHRSLVGLYYLVRFGFGEWLTVAIILGILYTLFRKTRSALILLSVIIPFLVVFIMIAAPSSARYYTAIIPLLLLFPSFLIIDILKPVHIKVIKFLAFIAIVLILALPSIKNSYLTSLYFSWPQSQTLAAKWMENNFSKNSIVAVSAVPLPLTKNIQEIDINPVGATTLLSMEELGQSGTQWIAVSSFYTSLVNSQRWVSSNLIKESFFNDNLFWELIDNTYISLTLNDIGAYRIKEFAKPFWQSPERAIFIAKMPDFWGVREDNLVAEYDFNDLRDREFFSKESLFDSKSKSPLTAQVGYDDMSSLYLDNAMGCNIEDRISSGRFPVVAEKWYSAVGFAKRESNPIYKTYRDGFFRLDFYSADNKLIRSNISKLLEQGGDWQKLSAAGFSPVDAKYGKISFQIDNCFSGEKYFIDNLRVFISDEPTLAKVKDYPFYNKQVPRNFLWLPEL